MGENMMCPAHKSSNKKSREGWERIFGKKKEDKENEEEESPQEEFDRLYDELYILHG